MAAAVFFGLICSLAHQASASSFAPGTRVKRAQMPQASRKPGIKFRARLSGDGHGKTRQIHAQAAFGVDRYLRCDVGGGYGNPRLVSAPSGRVRRTATALA
jgi:hypothetical protein